MPLADCFTLLMARVQAFQSQSGDTPEALSGTIDQLIDQAHAQALRQGASADTFRQALYPVLAWADETISRGRHWPDEHAWQPFLLQRRYFQTGLAGREFFERLEQLGPKDHDLREVYLLCLCLGFQGRYLTASNTADLTDIRMKHYRLLPQAAQQARAADARMFPVAYPAQSKSSRRGLRARLTPQRLLLILVPPLLILALALAMHAQLTQAVQQFRQAINL
ncbi:DotU family type IV/VI secretion system protein [Castellaniella hirudinis]|uniref:DotU family type IV/VI secretion system protein n=1 Tax=Castellaniella hirudinis TaxID=1144617 RepID=UPI0039C4E137